MSKDDFWKFFYEIYESIPRQGPGARESTERALRMLPRLGPNRRILDIGCGSGAQTIDLARASGARIVAVDNHPAFVSRLEERAATLGFSNRITARVGDMHELDFPDGSFDVVWSEGAIFIIGFTKGLASWRRLLAPGGYLVVSELCWFVPDPPPAMREIFMDDCEEPDDVDARREAIAAAGYRLLGDFVLPAAGWWENYYVPLGASLDRFCKKHAANPEALDVASRSRHEIDLYQKHAATFGYVFFVMQRGDSGE